MTNLARRKIAVIGKAPSSRDLGPYDDDDWEIWTLSNLNSLKEIPRWDRHFEIHPLDWFPERRDGYWEWLKQDHEKPIYLQELHEEIPSGVLYPKDGIVAKYGKYFTNTVSWMIAFAIEQKPTHLHVYGVDMAQDGPENGEYSAQRPSCEFFLGWAAGAGIEMYVPPQADMLKSRLLYGFETDGGEMREKWNARSEELKRRIANQTEARDQAALKTAFLQGAQEAQAYYKQWL